MMRLVKVNRAEHGHRPWRACIRQIFIEMGPIRPRFMKIPETNPVYASMPLHLFLYLTGVFICGI